ncbi:peptidyl-prolyl cis-trans isomerase FKBP4-like [Amphibalanus amphitrite]|uniref:peptidyl-prolyl cis-trans isomerase FKBP4-like n=1 Tax=Amphibalanus amphitrite TaxID=1232801 RepID=UPI001C911D78|nr:peptidyl-prolyl cis-trans isomerase FKBP4-like [Amphibalanus amphitrite]XP_043196517.1 peptidyl-prolyl cis-trans isomerase FKBP4-like [Amphibalanus amphitrite]
MGEQTDSEAPAPAAAGYVPGPNAIDISGDGGVMKEVLRAGTGDDQPQSGDKVFVHYVGTLASDGSKFDSSRDRGDKFDFTLGEGQVIKAWDLGVATMRRGELAMLTCQAEYAYGASGSPPRIPPNATLCFEVELFDWRGEDLSRKKDGGIVRRQVEKGAGFDTPNDGATVEVSLSGSLDGRVFDEREVTFVLGEGSEHGICPGVEEALEKFKTGERSRLTLTAPYAFGDDGHTEYGVLPGATVQYEVKLKSFEKAKERWEFDAAGKLEQAKLYKEKGTNYFKAGKFQLAEKNYKRCVEFLEFETSWSEEEKPLAKEVELAGHLNLAMCYIKLTDYVQARAHCDKALEIDANNVKGLFRRGQALAKMNEPELARADFQRVIQLDPQNKAAAHQAQICAQQIRAAKAHEKKIYANMFERLSKMEERESPAKKNEDFQIGHFEKSGESAPAGDAGDAAPAAPPADTEEAPAS